MKGVELYEEAKRLIPGGSGLYSKRGELHAPGQWPQYYAKARGIRVTDLDGQVFRDFSGASVGATILGYGDEDVDQAVLRAVAKGSTSALCPPEEVELARLLVLIHPWAQMCRFTRSGGEAMTVAIRIAQAATGRESVGWRDGSYHGWHVNDPRTGTPFIENNSRHWNLAAMIVEPRRLAEPDIPRLKRIRDHCTEKGIVLIFDEISCGFRSNLGGAHLELGVVPDIAVFSKAMSNGYPMAAVVGKQEIMAAAERSFISSTTWSERIGPTAALATIQKLWANDVFPQIKYIGELVRDTVRWEAAQSGVPITVEGPPEMLHFRFQDQETQTAYTLGMLERGFLAGKDFYPTYAHTIEDVEDFKVAVGEVLRDIKSYMGVTAESGIKR